MLPRGTRWGSSSYLREYSQYVLLPFQVTNVDEPETKRKRVEEDTDKPQATDEKEELLTSEGAKPTFICAIYRRDILSFLPREKIEEMRTLSQRWNYDIITTSPDYLPRIVYPSLEVFVVSCSLTCPTSSIALTRRLYALGQGTRPPTDEGRLRERRKLEEGASRHPRAGHPARVLLVLEMLPGDQGGHKAICSSRSSWMRVSSASGEGGTGAQRPTRVPSSRRR